MQQPAQGPALSSSRQRQATHPMACHLPASAHMPRPALAQLRTPRTRPPQRTPLAARALLRHSLPCPAAGRTQRACSAAAAAPALRRRGDAVPPLHAQDTTREHTQRASSSCTHAHAHMIQGDTTAKCSAGAAARESAREYCTHTRSTSNAHMPTSHTRAAWRRAGRASRPPRPARNQHSSSPRHTPAARAPAAAALAPPRWRQCGAQAARPPRPAAAHSQAPTPLAHHALPRQPSGRASSRPAAFHLSLAVEALHDVVAKLVLL